MQSVCNQHAIKMQSRCNQYNHGTRHPKLQPHNEPCPARRAALPLISWHTRRPCVSPAAPICGTRVTKVPCDLTPILPQPCRSPLCSSPPHPIAARAKCPSPSHAPDIQAICNQYAIAWQVPFAHSCFARRFDLLPLRSALAAAPPWNVAPSAGWCVLVEPRGMPSNGVGNGLGTGLLAMPAMAGARTGWWLGSGPAGG